MAETKKISFGGLPTDVTAKVERAADSYAWLLAQAKALEAGNLSALDRKGLAEELEDMAALRRDEVVGLLRVVLTHLLKWRDSRVRRSDHRWTVDLTHARVDLADLLEDSTVLRNELPVLLVKAYRGARKNAGAEMRFKAGRDWERLFPIECPWTIDEVLQDDFVPDIAPDANGRS